MAIFLELRLFRYDEEQHGPYSPASGETIETHAVEFANLANAAATYEDLDKRVQRVIEKGTPQLEERLKPGGVPYSRTPRDENDPPAQPAPARPGGSHFAPLQED